MSISFYSCLFTGTMGKEGNPGDVDRHKGRMYFMKQRQNDNEVADTEVKYATGYHISNCKKKFWL